MIELIGAPFDLSGPMLGSRLGPTALRLFGLAEALRGLGHEVVDTGDCVQLSQTIPAKRDQVYREAIDASQALRAAVRTSLERGAMPVVMGGDHSLGMGSVSGAIDHFGEKLAVLWIDAHMDLNTPDTTPSGNLHGMPLAALGRLAPGPLGGQRTSWGPSLTEAWSEILSQLVPRGGIKANQVAWIGLRDVDEGEVRNLSRMEGAMALTMQDVDNLGARGAIQTITDWLDASGATKLWVSFDIDALDPVFAPGTGTAVRGGLTYREGHLLAEALYEMGLSPRKKFDIVGIDLVEVNPLHDNAGETARVTLEWASSLFGKTIFGPAASR